MQSHTGYQAELNPHTFRPLKYLTDISQNVYLKIICGRGLVTYLNDIGTRAGFLKIEMDRRNKTEMSKGKK